MPGTRRKFNGRDDCRGCRALPGGIATGADLQIFPVDSRKLIADGLKGVSRLLDEDDKVPLRLHPTFIAGMKLMVSMLSEAVIRGADQVIALKKVLLVAGEGVVPSREHVVLVGDGFVSS